MFDADVVILQRFRFILCADEGTLNMLGDHHLSASGAGPGLTWFLGELLLYCAEKSIYGNVHPFDQTAGQPTLLLQHGN
ncbi:hypothetical protein BMS3Bbin04_01538 [bacterium BMS3Bbin04]|nr:hypothetical protein BMS3Bbin04_01538 [bacterium BMS3Bbin04]